tara:strand:- start:107 stop:382 length:276 start_codon:yes stop_codon:yes gene_type:complete
MSEENKTQEEDWNTDYLFFNHEAKRDYILNRMFEVERLHFELMVDKYEEGHSEFESWKNAAMELKQELERLRFLYKQYGGTLGSEQPYDFR